MGFSPRIGQASGSTRRPKLHRTAFEWRITWLSALLVLPALIVSAVLIWLQAWSLESKVVLFSAEILVSLVIGATLHDYIVRPLQTIANVVGALREEDYSFRARLPISNDALGELSIEVNALADLLAQNRTGAIEAAALVQRVVEEVDIPIFAFDPSHKLRLVNSAGEQLLQLPSEQLLGKAAGELRLEICLSCENEALLQLEFGGAARWFVRRSSFRQHGVPHTLVVLSDVSHALREEERHAWQRLIRVMGHELNNSLTPIKSIAGSLQVRLGGMELSNGERQDFERGLSIIESRAASLNRFLQAYRQLAQMPSPSLKHCSLTKLATEAAALETRVAVTVIPGPEVVLFADPDQLEQMLINLLRNAAEAALRPSDDVGNANGSKVIPHQPRIDVTWTLKDKEVLLTIEDNGPGLMNPSNVFVPFYTTKPEGSGIGLVLSRQIAEAHGGFLELSNGAAERGCIVKLTLPLESTLQSNRKS